MKRRRPRGVALALVAAPALALAGASTARGDGCPDPALGRVALVAPAGARFGRELGRELAASTFDVVPLAQLPAAGPAQAAALRAAGARRAIRVEEEAGRVTVVTLPADGEEPATLRTLPIDRRDRVARRRLWIALAEHLRAACHPGGPPDGADLPGASSSVSSGDAGASPGAKAPGPASAGAGRRPAAAPGPPRASARPGVVARSPRGGPSAAAPAGKAAETGSPDEPRSGFRDATASAGVPGAPPDGAGPRPGAASGGRSSGTRAALPALAARAAPPPGPGSEPLPAWTLGAAAAIGYDDASLQPTSHLILRGHRALWRGLDLAVRGRWPLVGARLERERVRVRSWTFDASGALELRLRPDAGAALQPFVGISGGLQVVLLDADLLEGHQSRVTFVPSALVGAAVGARLRVGRAVYGVFHVEAGDAAPITPSPLAPWEREGAGARYVEVAIGLLFQR